MEEVLDNFELGIAATEKHDPQEITNAIDLCIAKLQALVATNKITTKGGNIEKINYAVYNEAACLTLDQEELYTSALYAATLRRLFKRNDPEYDSHKKIFRYLLFQLQRNDNEIRHWEDDLDTLKHEVIETKMALKREEDALARSKALREAQELDVNDRRKEKFKRKIKNINNLQSLIREMIIMSEERLEKNSEIVELLKKYRKPFKPAL